MENKLSVRLNLGCSGRPPNYYSEAKLHATCWEIGLEVISIIISNGKAIGIACLSSRLRNLI